jgi:hypothetical protein
VGEGFGPTEFGLESALPDAPDQIMRETAERLVERFSLTIGRLYEDTRPTIDALVTAGYPLPPELRAPAELALAQRFEASITAVAALETPDRHVFARAAAVVEEARRAGIRSAALVTPRAAELVHGCVTAAVDRALADVNAAHVDAALGFLGLVRDLDIPVDTDAAQERAFAALEVLPGDRGLRKLAAALGLAV